MILSFILLLAMDDWEKYGQTDAPQQQERSLDTKHRDLDKRNRDAESEKRSRDNADRVLQDIAQCHGAALTGQHLDTVQRFPVGHIYDEDFRSCMKGRGQISH